MVAPFAWWDEKLALSQIFIDWQLCGIAAD